MKNLSKIESLSKMKFILIASAIFAVIFANVAYATTDSEEESTTDKMRIEIGNVEISEDQEEAEVNVAIKNADGLNGATLQIKYDERLEYVDIEEEYEEYYIQIVNNDEENYLQIVFVSLTGDEFEGDINIGALKFKINEKAEDSTYSIEFGENTELLSTQESMTYDIINGGISYASEATTNNKKLILIGVVIVVALVLLILIIVLIRRKKK